MKKETFLYYSMSDAYLLKYLKENTVHSGCKEIS